MTKPDDLIKQNNIVIIIVLNNKPSYDDALNFHSSRLLNKRTIKQKLTPYLSLK